MSASSFLRPSQVTEKKAGDAAMAFTLLCLLIGMTTGKAWALQLAMAILVLAMVAPLAFRYPAVVWFGESLPPGRAHGFPERRHELAHHAGIDAGLRQHRRQAREPTRQLVRGRQAKKRADEDHPFG